MKRRAAFSGLAIAFGFLSGMLASAAIDAVHGNQAFAAATRTALGCLFLVYAWLMAPTDDDPKP